MLNKVITIASAEVKTMSNNKLQTKLKDQDNLTYNIFHEKQDGSETVAYKYYKELQNQGVGTSHEISYDEKELKTPDNKSYTARTIVMFKVANVAPTTQINNQAKAKINGQNDEEKWKKRNEETKDNIRWCNALNNACLILSRYIPQGVDNFLDEDKAIQNRENMKIAIENMTNWIYKLEPQEQPEAEQINDQMSNTMDNIVN